MKTGKSTKAHVLLIHALDGSRLTSFTARKSYLGALGIGGGDVMKVEDLVDQLGQLVAETTDKWLRSAKLD